MTKKTTRKMQRLVGSNPDTERNANDFYRTPSYAVEALLRREKFEGDIWDPCCGDGAISKVLKKHGYSVFSSDLYDYGYGEKDIDFLHQYVIDAMYVGGGADDNIVMNPPFNLATEFALRALEVVVGKVAMFGKLSFLEGKERGSKLFPQRKLAKVYPFVQRVGFVKGNKLPIAPITNEHYEPNTRGKGLLPFAWFVFDQSYDGLPQIDWIPYGE